MVNIGEVIMSKSKISQKKVTLSNLNNHAITNKRQALKDLKMLDFDELQFKNTAQKRFYQIQKMQNVKNVDLMQLVMKV